ncbi:MAG TPA: cytochrome P450 [Pyrinomonadaceae bacterium]|nr:cytochrome P450 [Pyrinomonadaceae bacterium]
MTARLYPPGPKGRLFGLGLHLASQRDPLAFMERAARDFGDVVHFRLGRRHVYLFNHPEHVKHVLTTHYANFLKGRGVTRRGNFLGEGLLTSEGGFHRRQRQLTQPAFHHQRFDAYGAVMARLTREASAGWRACEPLDVLEAMRQITLPIASETLFGARVDGEHERIIAAFRTGLSRFRSFKSAAARASDRLSFLHRRRLRRARLDLESIVERIIVERRRTPDDRGDLLSLLLARPEEEDARLRDDRQIRDEAATLFIGGFENVATAMTWTWYLLAQHPEAEEKLHRELDGVLGGRLPAADDLPRLAYTRMVFEEAMRVYPPVPRLVRTAVREFEVGGYTVPAGSLVVVSQYLMHRDARYFPEPARFDPERWTPEAKRARPAYSFFPFGGGPRRCIGDGFAYMEGVLVLATLAARWRLRLASRDPVQTVATHFLHPRGTLSMIPERREAVARPGEFEFEREASAREGACERAQHAGEARVTLETRGEAACERVL